MTPSNEELLSIIERAAALHAKSREGSIGLIAVPTYVFALETLIQNSITELQLRIASGRPLETRI